MANRGKGEGPFEILARIAPIGLFRTDAAGDCVYVNDRWTEITGLSFEAAQGKGWSATLHPEDRERVFEEWYMAAERGVEFKSEYRFVRPDGQTRWVAGRALPETRDDVVVGYVGTVADITDRKLFEFERERLLGRERADRAEAEAANRMKDHFLAVLSHELRTPLTSAHGWLRIIRTQSLTGEKLHEALAVIERSVDMQLRVVNDLIDLSALAAGKVQLECAEFDLAELVMREVEALKVAASRNHHHLETTMAGPVSVDGDAVRLRQIVANLLSNALKFTPAGGRIDVTVRSTDSDTVEIAVSDSGRGLDPTMLSRVFEKFWQADGATTRQVGGLGLGLAIARSFVELHGGTVRAESDGLGKGARFTVTIPRRRPTAS